MKVIIKLVNFFTKYKTMLLPCFLFAIFTGGLVFVQKPWEDEAMFTCASYNLYKNGYLAVPGFHRVLGTVGVERHVYWIPPLNMVISAGWFNIFGYGLFQQRFLAFVFGLAGLITFYFLMKKLNVDEKIIFITLLLTSVDFWYTRQSANGRLCDIMCFTFCLLGFTTYILLREKNFILSVFVSNMFMTLACLTHPNGLLGFAGLIFLTIFFDFKNISFLAIVVFILPYLIGIVVVSFYIFEDVEAFLSQFWYGNVLTAGKQNLIDLVKNEFVKRYGMAYLGFNLRFPLVSKVLGIIPLIYFSSLIYTGTKVKENVSVKVMFYLTIIYLLVMTFVLAKKWNIQYLIFIIPFYNFCVSLLYNDLKKGHKFLSKMLLMVMIVLPVGVNIYRYIRNDYKKYSLDVGEINNIIGTENKVYGPLELGFGFGWDRVVDDTSLGFLSGKGCSYLVMDKNGEYVRGDENLKRYYPKVYKHQRAMVSNFKLTWEGRIYNLYAKKE
ncbi:MAG: glycosyltransferase family 39 protein [Endomicrobia bacterium]|nr:glycosyltransferase family 39 protein [Endomicrobiia bacterium]